MIYPTPEQWLKSVAPPAIAQAFEAFAEFRDLRERTARWHAAHPGVFYWTDFAGAKRLRASGTPLDRIMVPDPDGERPTPVFGLTHVGDLEDREGWVSYAEFVEA